jgi:TolB-like protein
MKKTHKSLYLAIAFVLVCAGSVSAQQQGQLSLDNAITQSAKEVEARLAKGAKLAVLNFSSGSEVFSDYVIEELSGALVMNNKVTVIERRSLDLIRKERGLQLSGDVSDDSATAIGKQLGAQAIVTGSLTNLGDVYRFRVKVINVETARIETQLSYNMGSDQRVTFLLQGNQQSTPAAGTAAGAASPAAGAAAAKPASASTVYKVGDTGPAGGIIFYDKGNLSDGWRYLEAAPSDVDKAKWSAVGSPLSRTGTELGTGKGNTNYVERYLRENGESNCAAQLCLSYSQGDYSDWFLPSKDELNLMYTNLELKGLGGFSVGLYWASSQSAVDSAWCQRFSDGVQFSDGWGGNTANKAHSYSVRAVRAF